MSSLFIQVFIQILAAIVKGISEPGNGIVFQSFTDGFDDFKVSLLVVNQLHKYWLLV